MRARRQSFAIASVWVAANGLLWALGITLFTWYRRRSSALDSEMGSASIADQPTLILMSDLITWTLGLVVLNVVVLVCVLLRVRRRDQRFDEEL